MATAWQINVLVPLTSEDKETDYTEYLVMFLEAITTKYGHCLQQPGLAFYHNDDTGNDDVTVLTIITPTLDSTDQQWWNARRQDWLNATGGHRSFYLEWYQVNVP